MESVDSNIKKPPYFALMGWSLFIFGVLGVLSGISGFFVLPALRSGFDQVLPQTGEMAPVLEQLLHPFFKFAWLANEFKLAWSVVAVWGSWTFLKRREVGRKVLLGLIYVMGAGVIGSYVWVFSFFETIFQTLIEAGWVTAGMLDAAPTLTHPLYLFLLFLMIGAVGLNAWYFHWSRVRGYMDSP